MTAAMERGALEQVRFLADDKPVHIRPDFMELRLRVIIVAELQPSLMRRTVYFV